MGEAAAFSATDDYKALVCVFLSGGNDHANTLIPFDAANHVRYWGIRGYPDPATGKLVALSRQQLASTVLQPRQEQVLTDDIVYSLSPWIPRLKARFDEGVVAPILNVGTLEAPLTRAQYDSDDHARYPRPRFLFSHNDQRSTWQSSRPEGARTGWGGRMADLAQSANQNAMFTAINVNGTSVFLSGEHAIPYRVTPRGAPRFDAVSRSIQGSSTASRALETLLRSTDPNLLRADYAKINSRSLEYAGFVNDALKNASVATSFGTKNDLADQLAVVARLISARQSLGVRRQIFYVTIKGFDSHSNLDLHQKRLGDVDFALDAFFGATLELGVADKVTAFTASDFGRTLSLNGSGSDHGWGGHHFVIGGSVKGGRFYGRAPQVSLTSSDQIGRGRLLPTTSVDEYSATLAKWFGVPDAEMTSIQPNIGRFSRRDVGFLSAN